MKTRRSLPEISAEAAGALLLAALIIYTAAAFVTAPDKIPIHFGAGGAADSWSGKGALFILPCAAALIYALITAVSRHPSIWNMPVEVTDGNRDKVYGAVRLMLVFLKILVTGVFFYIQRSMAAARDLSPLFLPATIILMAAILGFFIGYEACKFLVELSFNNNTDFFHANKSRFQNWLLAPMSSLVNDLHSAMKDIDPDIDTLPEYGHALVRMNRSTRFSKDKRPYKENYWCKLGVKNELDIPMFFFEIKPNSYSWGMGLYTASPKYLERLRAAIKASPSVFEEIISPFYGEGLLAPTGDSYKKDKAEGLTGGARDFCNRKDMAVVAEAPADELLFSPGLADFLRDEFNKLSGLYRLLMKIYHEDK